MKKLFIAFIVSVGVISCSSDTNVGGGIAHL